MHDEDRAMAVTSELKRETALSRLDEHIAMLSRELTMLEERMVPVLRNVGHDREPEAHMLAEVGESALQDRVRAIDGIRRRITDLIQNLDV